MFVTVKLDLLCTQPDQSGSFLYTTRDTREGWPLLTVESEENGDSKSTNRKALVCWARHAGTRGFYPTMAALWSAKNRILFPHRRLSVAPSHPATSWAGGHAGPPVSECVISIHNSPISDPT